jgi:hypothetical protein
MGRGTPIIPVAFQVIGAQGIYRDEKKIVFAPRRRLGDLATVKAEKGNQRQAEQNAARATPDKPGRRRFCVWHEKLSET